MTNKWTGKYLDERSHRLLGELAHRDWGKLAISCQHSRCPERRSNPQTPTRGSAVSLIHQHARLYCLVQYFIPDQLRRCTELFPAAYKRTVHLARPFNKQITSFPIWNLTLYFIRDCRCHFSALLSFVLYAISVTKNSTQQAETKPLNTEFHMSRPTNITWPCVYSFVSTQQLQQPPNSINQSACPGTKRFSASQGVPPPFRGPEIWYRF